MPVFNPDTGKFKTRLRCVSIPVPELKGLKSKDYLAEVGLDVPWDTLEQMFFNFTVRTTTFRQMGPYLGGNYFLIISYLFS